MTEDSFREEVIIAGSGGQGIILAGKLIAQTAMTAGKQVTYIPSYGAEMRGGTANSMIIIADDAIASPLVSKPNSVIALNKASVKKFSTRIRNGGLLIMNSSIVEHAPELDKSIEILAVPADELAVELGNPRIANMVALGAYLQKLGLFGHELAAECLSKVLARRYHKTLPINARALERGAEFAQTCKS